MKVVEQFSVRFINVDGIVPETFATVEEAIERGKRTGFEFAVDGPRGLVATWTVFGGLRWRTTEGRVA